ncbi:MAG TPA: hypothetical protein VMG08_03085 [Allosphingosinicella sp.]|nr:hypothetical protein [Allosphingosinicella sp.]
MGLTLVAILTAALLLPGIVAARFFYLAGETPEVEVPIPSLSSANGIWLVGALSVAVHVVYVLLLKLIEQLPPLLPLPLANPYLLFVEPIRTHALDAAWALFSGLAFLTLIAMFLGYLFGLAALKWQDKSRFYGPISDVIESAKGDDKFITAYVLTKIQENGRLVGYEGTVDSLFRDGDRFPAKVVLKDVVAFYLTLGDDGPERKETDQFIDWLILSAGDWHNIAFRVYQLVEEKRAPSEPAAEKGPVAEES